MKKSLFQHPAFSAAPGLFPRRLRSPFISRGGTLSMRFLAAAALFALLLTAAGSFSALNSQGVKRGQGLSRSMEQAIRLYHEGEDSEAMDRFMNILVRGTPAEKSLANEYISRITLRMNTGVQTLKGQPPDLPAGDILEEVEPSQSMPLPAQGSPAEEALGTLTAAPRREVSLPEEEEAEAAQEDPEDQRDRIAGKISERITRMRRALLLELNKFEAVKIYMGEPLPKAITLEPKYFFSSETVFKAGAAPALADLAALLFTLGKSTVLILPEGSAHGEIKIKSIRQAIALNSYLISRGISQSRIDVNLTGADIKFPRELSGGGGIILLLSYETEPKLTGPDDSRLKAPKISLGIYPASISVQKNEGALVEFSVFKSPVGEVSWKFEIAAVRPNNSLLPLQKMESVGQICRQSYWNARKNFFGAPYPAGRYIFTISATDVEGRESSMSRFLLVKSPREEEAARAARKPGPPGPAAAPAAPAKKSAAPKLSGKPPVKGAKAPLKAAKAPLKGAKTAAGGAAVKGKVLGKTPARSAKAAPKKAGARAPKTDLLAEEGTETGGKAPAEAAQAEFSGQVSYKIYFREGTAVVTPNSEKKLAQVAETMNYYPMAQIKLIGYAYSGEAEPETAAKNRVDFVASRLSGKYRIESGRMETSTQISDSPKSMVEIKMLGKE